MNSTIRAARPDDLHEIMRMGEAFFDESGFSSVTTFDHESFLMTITTLLAIKDGGSLLVAEQHDQVIGMAGGVSFPLFMNRHQIAFQELFWWVSPDYRAGIGAALLTELEADARRKGASVFITAQIAGQRDGAFRRLYERRGYRPSENTFMKVLN